MQALQDYIVVMEGEKAKERKGIILPDSAQEHSNKAEVIAVGPDVRMIEVGDTILLPMDTILRVMTTHTADLMIDDKPAFVVKEGDVAVYWPKKPE
jgi:co-chaperonin GroES (HSP10)